MQAGTTIACACGRIVAVPLLSELRRQVKVLADGSVPTNGRCLQCGGQTSRVAECKAICERVWVDSVRGPWNTFIWIAAILIWPMAASLAIFLRGKPEAEERQERGREVVVRLPFHLCEACRVRQELRKTHDLRAALQRVPEYAELFREYPEAELSREGW
jgi:hypothetical protein